MKNFKRSLVLVFLLIFIFSFSTIVSADNALVFQTDFGLKDGAVSAMKGVSYGVDDDLDMYDLTHGITPFDIWEGAYRLHQTAGYWPEGTVFVSVVDPGVGTERKSIVLKSQTEQYFVTPDNGTITLIADNMGIDEVRIIDESKHRLEGSKASHTFHGRDVYAYTGAKLASGKISFKEVGPVLEKDIVKLDYQKAKLEDNVIKGTIPILDVQYGNVWTNIPKEIFDKLDVEYGDMFHVKIYNNEELVYEQDVPFVSSFGDVKEGKPLLYLNSLLNLSIALNWDDFAATYGVDSGPNWEFVAEKIE